MTDKSSVHLWLIVAGNHCHLVSLALPVVVEDRGPLLGVVCWAFSVVAVFSVGADGADWHTTFDAVSFFSGLANIWWTVNWFPLLWKYEFCEVNQVWAGLGLLAFAVSVSAWFVVEPVSIGYYLWSLSFLLIALGLCWTLKGKGENGLNTDDP